MIIYFEDGTTVKRQTFKVQKGYNLIVGCKDGATAIHYSLIIELHKMCYKLRINKQFKIFSVHFTFKFSWAKNTQENSACKVGLDLFIH